MIILYAIVFIIFPAAVLYNIRFFKKGQFNDGIISLDESSILKGVAAWFIMISHYVTNIGILGYDTGIAKVYEWFGGIGVCMFFFLSGYGLYMSAKRTSPTFRQLIKRELNVLIPMAVIQLIFWLSFYGSGKSFLDCILYITALDGSLWFLSEIMLIYIIFYLGMRFFKKHDILAVALMCLIMSAVFFILDFPARWYNANLVFALGMLFAKRRDSIIAFFKKRYVLKLILSFALFAVLSICYSLLNEFKVSHVLKLLSGCALNIALFSLMLKVRLRSKIMDFFGNMSLQMFVVHVNVWGIVYHFMGFDLLVAFIVSLAASAVLTIAVYYAEQGIRKLLKVK